jgi:hypothetical protein
MDQEMIRTLGRLEGKIDLVLDSIEDHSKRLGILERWQARVVGMAAVVSAIASAAWHYFTARGV